MGYVHKLLIGIKMYLSNCVPAHNYIESTHRYRYKIISLTPRYNLCNSNRYMILTGGVVYVFLSYHA